MEKFAFLDIDGVLNHQLYYKEEHQASRRHTGEYPYSDVDPEKVELLNSLIEDTGVKVVCSSSWRKSYSPKRIEEILVKRGYKYKILGNTPVLRYDGYTSSVPRGCEIKAWLDEHTSYGDIYRYVILDDDSDMLLNQRENYFQVDGYCGLTPNIIYRATRFLNKEGM